MRSVITPLDLTRARRRRISATPVGRNARLITLAVGAVSYADDGPDVVNLDRLSGTLR